MRFERWLYTIPLRLRSLARPDRVDAELEEELRYHLDRQVEENLARGMNEEEALRAARKAMGQVEQHKEECRDARRVAVFEEFAQDLRYGLRGLMKNRGFAAVAVLTLGLGIGANTAVFSVINTVFLKPLPFRDADRLVVLYEDATSVGYPKNNPSPGNFIDWTKSATVFEDMVATAPIDYSVTGDGEPERLSVQAVTANMFSTLGVQPALGRGFLAEEDRAGGPRAVVLGDGLWRRRYGADPGIVGREIKLDGRPHTVVGVMPPGFQIFDRGAVAWVPMRFGPEAAEARGSHFLEVFARLKPGATVAQAQAEMQSIMERIGREYPEQAARTGAVVVPLRDDIAGDVRQSLLVLMAAVSLVLLIACINVGNLMLSRAAARGREIAVRAALGASRGRMVRQMLTENIPLVTLGTLVGLAFAYWSFAALKQLVPRSLSESGLGLDVRVLAFTLLVAVAAAVLFGLAPALTASKANLNEALRSGSSRTGVSAGGRLRSALVVGEVSLAIALLVGAGLLIQTFFLLRGQYAELQAAHVLTMKTVLPRLAYDTHEKKAAFFDEVVERVSRLPGVAAAGYTNALPLDYRGDSTTFYVEGQPPPQPGDNNDARTRLVTPDFLKALGVPLRQGRHFTAADGPQALPVAVVNETMAKKYWPNGDPIGKRLKLGDPGDDTPWVTVVGVAADVRQDGVDMPARAEVYFPYEQAPYLEWASPKALAIRTTGDTSALVAAVRREIAAVDPNQAVSDVKSWDDIYSEQTAGRRLGTMMLGLFAGVALLLASIGIYGLLAQLVEQRTPEIGVRMALGARPRDVVALVVGRGMKLVLIGSVVGLALSFALTRLMSSLLFGVGATDPLTLAGVPVLLGLVALVACLVPARRAARVDPNVALRYE